MSDETSFCKNCKRSVPTTSFTLHSTHCERFIQICSKCQEPFPKSQLEEHENEVHKEINCKDCNQKLEMKDQIDHLANCCPKRLISCEFCEVQCIASNITDHELACGSRTEMCDICKNHVLVRMLKIHEELQKIPTASSTFQGPSNILDVSKEKVSNVEDKNVNIPKYRNVVCQNILQASAPLPATQHISKTKNFEKPPSKLMEDEDKHSLLPCEFCGAPCTIESLEKHQMLCGSNLEACPRCQKHFAFGQLSTHVCSQSLNQREPQFEEEHYWSRYVAPAVKEGIVDEEDSIPCGNCGSLFPISCLELHEIACKFSDVSTTNTVPDTHENESQTQLPATLSSTVEDDYWSQYANVAPTIENSMTAEEETHIPCEICGIPFPLSSLELHEISCKFASVSTRKEILTSGTGITVAQTKPNIQHNQPDNEITFLPCSFCNIVISSSILEMHEARCSNFSQQQTTIRSQVAKPLSKKTEIKNTRPESSSQRALRENALLATENRLPNTPKIQQSQYRVVQLPDGSQVLKKRNIDSDDLDVGHVLGRKQQQEFDGNHFNAESNGINKEMKKSLFQESSHLGSYSVKAKRAYNNYMSADVQKRNSPEKSNVAMKPSSSHSNEMRISKKPNAAFKNYAYQPDAGNKLGREDNSANERKQMQNGTNSTSVFRSGNASVKGQPNARVSEVNPELQQQEARDRINAGLLGARPKRPQH
ncbi:TRAF-type zinc finger domain-containing protein 1-like isoform X2 [Daphnia pulex]|uniref:TRAF-type zinc finger domain-containing protein 1-like isoform X2 n=1 Tax=Daphnia pulex TaxID=6669 RepID=UPI001EDCFD94|nr:TRAF-type zinc finger domain-containing protein 1-like isoform X2 [Daphnia pulex]